MSGKIDGEHLEIAGEIGYQRGEVVARATETMQQYQRLAGADTVKSKNRRCCHSPVVTRSRTHQTDQGMTILTLTTILASRWSCFGNTTDGR